MGVGNGQPMPSPDTDWMDRGAAAYLRPRSSVRSPVWVPVTR